jgi:hypothetical protein
MLTFHNFCYKNTSCKLDTSWLYIYLLGIFCCQWWFAYEFGETTSFLKFEKTFGDVLIQRFTIHNGVIK